MKNRKIIFIFGTRPETIKLAPLYHYFNKHSPDLESIVAVTGQHKEMLKQALDLFEINPKYDFALMKPNQSLSDLTASIFKKVSSLLIEEKPDLVITQGDTTTTFVATMASFYEGIPIAHVEAGLRSFNNYSPFPEESNRKMVTILADYHFAPTKSSMKNLLDEGIKNEDVIISGNTVIDALKIIEKKLSNSSQRQKYIDYFMESYGINFAIEKKRILITGHRRESFGEGFENICQAIKKIAIMNPDIEIIFPVHLNPNVQEPVFKVLEGIDNVFLIDPQDYEPFIFLMINANIILTDSGGVQEEAPSLGKPVLVMRENTERPEGIEAGTAMLVGTDINKITNSVQELLDNESAYEKMANAVNPYGDGHASKYIHDYLIQRLIK